MHSSPGGGSKTELSHSLSLSLERERSPRRLEKLLRIRSPNDKSLRSCQAEEIFFLSPAVSSRLRGGLIKYLSSRIVSVLSAAEKCHPRLRHLHSTKREEEAGKGERIMILRISTRRPAIIKFCSAFFFLLFCQS